MKGNRNTVKMTEGNIWKIFISFMLPVIGGNLFNSLYNIVDTIIVGRYLGENALAAVGAAGTLVFVANGLGIGMVQGFGVVLAQEFGRGHQQKIRHYLAHVCVLAVAVLAVIMTIFMAGNHMWLHLMNTIPAIYDDIYSYQMIVYMGMPAVFLFQLSSIISQNMGDSKTPVYFMMGSAVSNVVLNITFIVVLGLGVEGVAYATIISQLVSALGCSLVVIKKYPEIHFQKGDFALEWSMLQKLLGMGFPVAMQAAIIQVGNVFTQIAMNQYSQVYLAAAAVIGKISSLIMLVYLAIGTTMAIFVAQNYGAGNIARIKQGVRVGNTIAGCYSVVCILIANLLFQPMVELFVGEQISLEMEHACHLFFYAVCWFYPVLGVLEVYRSSVRGLGRAFINMLSSCTEVAGKLIVVFGFGSIFGMNAIRFGNPISWMFTLIPILPCYFIVMRKLTRYGIESEKRAI
ncbi:MAG: MATE family efflux transporter [Eubacteriales bacterium]